MSNLVFVAQFTASKVGLDGLSPTWNVERITRSDGTRVALVTGGATSIVIGRNGQYGYLLTGADLTLYAYTATAITTNATVDQKELAAMADLVLTDTILLGGQAVNASSAVTFPAEVGTSTYAGGAVASVTGNIGGLSAAALQDVGDALASYGAALETTLQAAKAIITEVQALLEASAGAAAPMVLPED